MARQPSRRTYPALSPEAKRAHDASLKRVTERFSQLHTEAIEAGAEVLGEENIPEDMQPAPAFLDEISEPFDLGTCNPDLAGWEVKFNLSAPLSVQELLDELRSPRISNERRMKVAITFLKEVLAGWNFTRKTLRQGHWVIETIPQPPEGVDRIPLNLPLLRALIDAFGAVFTPSPD